jgi:hypothetical protein
MSETIISTFVWVASGAPYAMIFSAGFLAGLFWMGRP